MIVVKIKWSGEPEQVIGPFGQIGETLRWITDFKEKLSLNQPSAHAILTTHVIHDPVEAMTWTKTGANPFASERLR